MQKTYEIGEKIDVTVPRSESNFDRACEFAYNLAIGRFGIDEDGNSGEVIDFDRSTDSIVVEFVRYQHRGGMGGQEYVYEFVAWIERSEED